MKYESLLIEKSEGVGTITFNRPDRLNAFSEKMFEEFIAALHEMDRDSDVKVVVITGAGKTFSAGMDLDEARQGPSEVKTQVVPEQDTVAWIPFVMRNMKKPIIASLNGPAVGAGFTISLACDIRIAADNVKIGGPFLLVGLVPELGSTYSLPRLVGMGKACELVFTGKLIDAKEAKDIGLVNEVVPKEDLQAVTYKLAREIAAMPPIALQLARKALYQGLDNDLATQIQFEQLCQSTCFKTEDHLEGVRAFLEKRKPTFTGK